VLAINQNPVPYSPLDMFDSLRAEDEEAWLPKVFLPPPEFELMRGSRSVVIIGDEGSGKTALYHALQRAGQGNLLVRWHPRQPSDDNTETLLREVLAVCAVEIIAQATAIPTLFEEVPAWATKEIDRFVQRYHTEEAIDRARIDVSDSLYFQHVTQQKLPDYYSRLPDDEIIRELVRALRQVGFGGVWVLSDTTIYYNEGRQAELEQALTQLLSLLSLFERGSFSFKLFINATSRFNLARASAVNRRRIEAYRLNWSRERLLRLVETRLAVALPGRVEKLAQLCDVPDLPDWLEQYQGHNPRLWLEIISRLLGDYLAQNPEPMQPGQPVPAETWEQIQLRHPLLLTLDASNRNVFIGRQAISLSPRPFEFISYLYERAGQFCSKEELFYRVHQGLDTIPSDRQDPNWVMPAKHSGPVDNMVWRLRKEIERDPKTPVYIITDAGKVALFPYGLLPAEE
jgi:hypothetical protein